LPFLCFSKMSESWSSKIDRFKFNFFPAYRGSGARILYISSDYREIRIKIPLNWRTKNYVGTIYGGSMYSGIDPIYMVMLIKNLGKNYVVWDKSASIRFKKPGRETLFAEFKINETDLDEIKNTLLLQKSVDKIYKIELKDRIGKVHCVIEKTIYIANK
jgi:hypothetical protein